VRFSENSINFLFLSGDPDNLMGEDYYGAAAVASFGIFFGFTDGSKPSNRFLLIFS